MSTLQHATPFPGADSRAQIPALDGLRALAILAVILYHTVNVTPRILFTDSGIDRVAWLIARTGWIGVDLFFVLSGFLITGILLDTRQAPGYFRTFYSRRVLRIFPLYYASLIVLLYLLPHFASPVPPGAPSPGQIWVWTYLSNVRAAVAGHWNATPMFTGHFWSLAVEEQFYLVWPLVVLLLPGPRLRTALLGLILGVAVLRVGLMAAGVNPLAIYVLTPTRMDVLAIGAFVALAAREPGGLLQFRRWSPGVLALCAGGVAAIVLLSGNTSHDSAPMQAIGYSLLGIGFGAGLVSTLGSRPDGLVQRIVTHRWLRYVGRRSYALYVVHPAVVFFLRPVGLTDRLPLIGGSALFRQLGFSALALSAALVVAEVSWQLLEKRCLALKRYVPRPEGRPASRPGSE